MRTKNFEEMCEISSFYLVVCVAGIRFRPFELIITGKYCRSHMSYSLIKEMPASGLNSLQ